MTTTTKNVLTFGASGMLGQELMRIIHKEPGLKSLGLSFPEIDITSREAVFTAVKQIGPSIVFNCAAMTDVDGCERDPQTAHSINALGASHIAQACAECGALLVHVSTDFVFDGTARQPYLETDKPNPVCVYGASKLEGEKYVESSASRHVIARTAWLFGPGRSNFVTKILERAGKEKEFSVVDDQVGSPTYAPDLAQELLFIAQKEFRGIINVTNSGSCSRYEFAAAALKMAGLSEVKISGAPTARVSGIAPRPAYSVLDTAILAKLKGSPPRPWQAALKKYISLLTSGPA
jgi:dTDP-4-dehydrorhamnose reductase